MITVQVRYFASLREALGAAETLQCEPGSTVGTLRAALLERGGRHAEVLEWDRAVRCSVNQHMCDDATALTDGAELAFFPPVTGG